MINLQKITRVVGWRDTKGPAGDRAQVLAIGWGTAIGTRVDFSLTSPWPIDATVEFSKIATPVLVVWL
jgi:hypothetical protein